MYTRLVCSLTMAALATSAACDQCAPDVTARGSASVGWTLTVADRAASCARAGAASVSLVLHPRAGGDVATSFACIDGHGTTPPVVAGPYSATLTLHAADGAVIATSPTEVNVTIGADQITELSPVSFVVDDRGNLVVSLASVGTTANCTDPSQGGAGLTGVTIALVRSVGSCAAVTFTRTRGAAQLGTYTVDCGSPQNAGCIERDETLTATVPAGGYVIHVIGFRGARRCRAEDDIFAVPGGAITTARTIQLAPGC